MTTAQRYNTSQEALDAVLRPGVINSPLSVGSRKALRVVMILLGLFVLGALVVGQFGKKVERKFQEEAPTSDPWGGRNNPWGRR